MASGSETSSDDDDDEKKMEAASSLQEAPASAACPDTNKNRCTTTSMNSTTSDRQSKARNKAVSSAAVRPGAVATKHNSLTATAAAAATAAEPSSLHRTNNSTLTRSASSDSGIHNIRPKIPPNGLRRNRKQAPHQCSASTSTSTSSTSDSTILTQQQATATTHAKPSRTTAATQPGAVASTVPVSPEPPPLLLAATSLLSMEAKPKTPAGAIIDGNRELAPKVAQPHGLRRNKSNPEAVEENTRHAIPQRCGLQRNNKTRQPPITTGMHPMSSREPNVTSVSEVQTDLHRHEWAAMQVLPLPLSRGRDIAPEAQPGATAVQGNFRQGGGGTATTIQMGGTTGTGGHFNDEDEMAVTPDKAELDQSGFLVEATLVDGDSGGNGMSAEDLAELEANARQRVMEEMVIDAEAAVVVVVDDEDPGRKFKKRRRTVCLCVLFLLVLIAVILGSVLGSASSRSGKITTELLIVTPAPTVSLNPSASPSRQPTSSSQPSGLPSAKPSTIPSLRPTNSPRPSTQPSPSPSSLPTSVPTESPDNNYCDQATEILVGDTVFVEELFDTEKSDPIFISPSENNEASSIFPSIVPSPPELTIAPSFTENSEVSSIIPSIIPSPPELTIAPSFSENNEVLSIIPSIIVNPPDRNIFTTNLPSSTSNQNRQFEDGSTINQNIIGCEFGVYYNRPGRWYRLKGIGPVTATTCNDQTTAYAAIHVYSDTRECPSDSGMSTCPTDLMISRGLAECTSVSWLSVAGADYLILLTESSLSQRGGGAVAMTILASDKCSNAFGPLSTNGQTYSGFFGRNTTVALDGTVKACGRASAPTHSGVWFQVAGTGGLLRADTCTGTIIDTQISVFKGSCGNLECVDGNDDVCGRQSRVAWSSDPGVLYFVFVHPGGNQISGGKFALKLEGEDASFVANDLCSNAAPLDVGITESLNVTVPLGISNPDVEIAELACYARIDNGMDHRGLWYTVEGMDAKVYTISIDPVIGDDAFVTVLFGSCMALECDSFDPFLNIQTTTSGTWESLPGVTYYIYVHYTKEDVKESQVLLIVSAASAI